MPDNKKEMMERLARQIESAFVATPYPGDDRISYDATGYHLECKEIQEAFRGKGWKDLDLVFLRYHAQSIFFLTPAAYRFYLPAYLLACVRFRLEVVSIAPSVIFSLTPPERDHDSQEMREFLRITEVFNLKERRAIQAFITFVAANHEDSFPFDIPRFTLAKYWSG